MKQTRNPKYCKTCSEDITNVGFHAWTECSYCYWKRRLEKSEPLESLLQQRNALQSKQAELVALLNRAQTELQQCTTELNVRQPRWQKWLGIVPGNERVSALAGQIYRLQEEVKELAKKLQFAKMVIAAARHVRREFARASQTRAALAQRKQQSDELKQRFDAATLAIVGAIDFDRSIFRIRKKDYKRGNRLDNHFRKEIAAHVMTAFDNKCIVVEPSV